MCRFELWGVSCHKRDACDGDWAYKSTEILARFILEMHLWGSSFWWNLIHGFTVDYSHRAPIIGLKPEALEMGMNCNEIGLIIDLCSLLTVQ